MTSQQDDKYIIVITKDDIKYSGKLETVDKVNSKLILSKVTKNFQGAEESLEKIEIPRNDIKELRTTELSNNKTEEEQNFNAIPDNKISTENENNNLNKAYDKKKDFFDSLKPMSNPEVKQETKNYNQKNKDTFNMTDNNLNDDNNNNYHKRGKNLRGYGRGRGGYNRGRYNNYNNNYGRQYYNNNYNNNNYNNNYHQQNNNGSYYFIRGKMYRGRGRGKRGGFKNKFEEKQEDNNNKEQQEVKQENKEENK